MALGLSPAGAGEGVVFAANTLDRGSNALRFYCNEHFESCTVRLECATWDGQIHYEGTFAPLAARNARKVEYSEVREVVSWDGRSALTCRVWSEQSTTVQQLERDRDGRLIVSSGSVRSEDADRVDITGSVLGQYQSALIHSILSPSATAENEGIEITVFCEAPQGDECGCSPLRDPACEPEDQVRLICSEDDGTVHEHHIGRIPRHATLLMSEETIARHIDHRWEGRGLSCEVRSDYGLTVEMSHIVDGRTIANNSASVQRLPIDDSSSTLRLDDPLSLPVRAYAYAIPSSESRDQADLLMYCNDEHHHCPAWLECTTQSGEVLGKWVSPPSGDSPRLEHLYRRAHLVIPPRGLHRMSAQEIEETITEGSWAGQGRLSCAIRSDKDIRAQVWIRSGEHPQTNNTYYVRSEEVEGLSRGIRRSYQAARVHSVPAPGALDVSNIRIHCTAGERCDRLRISCSEDDGTVHEGAIDPIPSKSVRHIKTAELVDIIDHRWEGIALACEVQSDRAFNLQLLTRTGDSGVLLNGSLGVNARKP